MRFLAIVRTMVDAPDWPVLDDAWDAGVAAANPAGVHQSLADALVDGGTDRAAVVVIEVADATLLERLRRPDPVLAGDVAAAAATGGPPRVDVGVCKPIR